MYTSVDDIIQNCLEPRLKDECGRLGMPQSFVEDVYATFPKPLSYPSACEPIETDGKIRGVRIRISCEIRSPKQALRHFWHEMRPAKDYYDNKRPSGWKAAVYAWRRHLEDVLR